jgi:hypothetical protein
MRLITLFLTLFCILQVSYPIQAQTVPSCFTRFERSSDFGKRSGMTMITDDTQAEPFHSFGWNKKIPAVALERITYSDDDDGIDAELDVQVVKQQDYRIDTALLHRFLKGPNAIGLDFNHYMIYGTPASQGTPGPTGTPGAAGRNKETFVLFAGGNVIVYFNFYRADGKALTPDQMDLFASKRNIFLGNYTKYLNGCWSGN